MVFMQIFLIYAHLDGSIQCFFLLFLMQYPKMLIKMGGWKHTDRYINAESCIKKTAT